jgi:hypothetical protein
LGGPATPSATSPALSGATKSDSAPIIINGSPVELPSAGATGPALGPAPSSASPSATGPNSAQPDEGQTPRYSEARREAAGLFSDSPSVPPTPDQVDDYSVSRTKQAPIKPLPPVELPTYPSSRY